MRSPISHQRKGAPQIAVPLSASARLSLVPKEKRPHDLLALWHLVSLDAPTVAALWTVFLARAAGLHLPWVEPAAMFVAVWMLYAADRLLDARPLPDGSMPPDLEERHLFHQRYRNRFLAMICMSSLLLVYLLHRIDARSLHLYTLLATLLGAWLLLIHARQSPAHRLPKELAVGVFFSAAVFIPTVARVPQLQFELVPAAALLAAVCTLNCLCIYAWEHPAHRMQAHATTRWATSHLAHLAIVVVVLASFAAVLAHASYVRYPAISCAMTAVLLLALNGLRRHLSAVHLRAFADLALLTPLVFFL
jgi:hypothetical protein